MADLTATLQVRLEPSLKQELERRAAEHQRTPSWLARFAILQLLEQMRNADILESGRAV